MKRIFILLTLMACMTGVHAQETDDDYLPLLAEGKVWTQNIGEIPAIVIYIDGDTIMHGRACKKLMYHMDESFGSIKGRNTWFLGGFYEECSRVWFYYPEPDADAVNTAESCDTSIPRLCYDFTANVGQELELWVPNCSGIQLVRRTKVLETWELDLNGRRIRCLSIENSGVPTIWLEGVGSLCGFDANIMDIVMSPYYYGLKQCTMNGTVVYTDEWQIPESYYEKQGSQHNAITQINGSASSVGWGYSESKNLYDLSGRRLSARPTKGLYIEDGKVRAR